VLLLFLAVICIEKFTGSVERFAIFRVPAKFVMHYLRGISYSLK
jgi:hypothetical protein